MESYPAELLVGVFPLVFCVDATNGSSKDGSGNNKDGSDAKKESGDRRSSSNRTPFDKFLDNMAASLLEEPTVASSENTPTKQQRNSNNIFRVGSNDMQDLQNDSDADDDYLLNTSVEYDGHGQDGTATGSSSNTPNTRRVNSLNLKFPKLPNPRRRPKRSHSVGDNQSNTSSPSIQIDDTFRNQLQQGQSFFQRARIISIGMRYGFPPSKDPQGDKGRVQQYVDGDGGSNFAARSSINSHGSHNQQQQNSNIAPSNLLKALQQRPIDGILPSGWLEKHAAALPSVILIVLQLHHGSEFSRKEQQQTSLKETLQNLHYSLAPKRQMQIHVVGLVETGVSSIAMQQWQQSMQETLQEWQAEGNNNTMQESPQISLIPTQELQPDAAYHGSELQQLHDYVRTASLDYYQHQARHVKQKLLLLGSERTLPVLLPLSIRYCFQLAMFYEFQWKQSKSLKYMVEAHRLLEVYYRYLLEASVGGNPEMTTTPNDQQQSGDATMPRISGGEVGSEGVELSLTSPSSSAFARDMAMLNAMQPPPDMLYQCRAVADWIHFKILQSCLVSNTQGGLVAASQQWQRHAQSFCCPRRSFLEGTATTTEWLDWSYVARQHVVLGQLLERHPPRALLGNNAEGQSASSIDETLLRLSPWKSYQGAAEAFLNIGYHLRQADGASFSKEQVSDARTRYVGGMDHEGFAPLFQEESKVNHREEALKYATRGIALFNQRNESTVPEGNDAMEVGNRRRAIARLQYIAGGILLGLSRALEALPYLEDASDACKGWNGLEFAVSRLLVECYGSIDNYPSDRNTSTLASKLLVAYFRAAISEDAFRTALARIAALTGDGEDPKIQWNNSISDGDDSDSPLAFSMTFPNGSHGTAGDSITASICIYSRMDFAVQLDSVTILSFAGSILVPDKDLLAAKNVNEASNGGIIIQAHNHVEITTSIELPSDLQDSVASEASSPGGTKPAPAKKSARPRTAGITAGAGSRFVMEDSLLDSKSTQRPQKSPWSKECLGGKPIECNGLEVVLSPVNSQTKIECTLERKASRSEASVKRTPFEEENYLSAAWERPKHLPMTFGPRCLRILPPMPTMVVTDVTAPLTQGVALEGTVNRIVLGLTAARSEECSDITVQVKCNSTLASTQESDVKQEDLLSRDLPDPRLPVLVKVDTSSKAATTSSGYNVPDGWAPVSDGQFEVDGGNENYSVIASPSLKRGASTYTSFDIYRPALGVEGIRRTSSAGDVLEATDAAQQECRTDIQVSIRYRQEKKSSTTPEDRDLVTLEHTVSLVWKPAVNAAFTCQPNDQTSAPSRGGGVLIGDKTTTSSCSIEAGAAADGLDVSIDQVQFVDPAKEEKPDNTDVAIYINETGTSTDALGCDSVLSVAWPNGESTRGGPGDGRVPRILSVSWRPVPLQLPQEISLGADGSDGVSNHGPLSLAVPSVCYFRVPSSLVEDAPFDVQVDRAPDSLQVGVPFELSYSVMNRTSMDQDLEIRQQHALNDSNEGGAILLGGGTHCAVSLSPFETYSLSFMVVPMKVGPIKFPHMSVWSKRYQTWVVQDSPDNQFEYCVLP